MIRPANPLMHRARQWLGVALREWPHYRQVLAQPDDDYLAICNRGQLLERATNGSGYRCVWQWTSDLHAPKFFAGLGRALMARALQDHPILLAESPVPSRSKADITFIIGHRGEARIGHLLATLRSIAGQKGARVECVVVEQDDEPRIKKRLPSWVRHVHTPPPKTDMPYCRSWTFNIGAQHARSDVLVLHDNDMLVPVDYAAWILERVSQGYEVVNPKRFIFYLTQAHTQAVFANNADLLAAAPEVIVQNLEAGGSVAITRAGYGHIGGLDESFIGWGGEDNEFWERAQTLRVWPWASLPLVHLWHAAQPGKRDATYHTARHYQALTQVSPKERIARLTSVPGGQMNGPQGWSEALERINRDS